MDKRNFNIWNKIGASITFVIATITYLLTIEPTASFWDCGEFIASSYKLEVGHPPGNPVFQIFAKIFTLFGDSQHAAALVNSASALYSALTILLLYLTLVWFIKRIIKAGSNGEYSVQETIAIISSSAVGALCYCFSDTFWFSAVEGEVYAMSSLFTALVFWIMTIWYDRYDEPHALRWIVLIAFLMGLSIGVHLLNLLAIPALVFMYFYRYKDYYDTKDYIKIALLGVALLALILFIIIPWMPKLAAYFDLFFVNVLGLHYNTGAAFFMIALLALCFWGIIRTGKKGKWALNTAILSFTVITIGFSIFTMDIIRSCAKTPTNEYQPDNAFTLVRYLSREQYGKTPLIYGQYYGADYSLTTTKYWAPVDGKYKKVEGPVDAAYYSKDKMLFPRMWTDSPDGSYSEFYKYYTGGKKGKPTMGQNLKYFFDYQCNWMYWRYFMWNFTGRQNDVHSPSPGNIFHGNWESGVKFIDNTRLGDQSGAPDVLAKNKGKNHYYFLPLLLGLLGLCFQFRTDKRGCFLNFIMFFMTGIAIVLYLNQPPYQVRERDYAYAGSFYFFSVWIGLGAAAIYNFFASKKDGSKALKLGGALASMLCLGVPTLMAEQNWDDHNRSNRRTSVEIASNYLNSVGKNGILITHGDNDTFPLWYAQEVESIRTDVRIVNTSLLGTDWHIDQMKYAVNESAPLNLTVPYSQYLYGTNEYIPIVDSYSKPMQIKDVMEVFKHPKAKVSLQSGKKVDYIPARQIVIPVNKANVLKSGIVDEKYADLIQDSITLTIPKGKDYITKGELFLLDFLSGYDWSRPLCMLNMGGDLNIGEKDYLVYEGYSFLMVPFKNKPSTLNVGFADTDDLYHKITDVFKFDAVAADNYFIDYQNYYTHMGVMSIRRLFVTLAKTFYTHGETQRAQEMLDRMVKIMANYPLDGIPLGFSNDNYMVTEAIGLYFSLGQKDSALELTDRYSKELLKTTDFYMGFYSWASDECENCAQYIYLLADTLRKNGQKELASELESKLKDIIDNS